MRDGHGSQCTQTRCVHSCEMTRPGSETPPSGLKSTPIPGDPVAVSAPPKMRAPAPSLTPEMRPKASPPGAEGHMRVLFAPVLIRTKYGLFWLHAGLPIRHKVRNLQPGSSFGAQFGRRPCAARGWDLPQRCSRSMGWVKSVARMCPAREGCWRWSARYISHATFR